MSRPIDLPFNQVYRHLLSYPTERIPALKTIKNILKLQEDHKKRLIAQKLSTPHAIALLDYLFEKPHLSINDIADKLKISYQGAKALVEQFVKYEILREITGKRRDKRYSYWEYLAFLSEGT